MILYDDDIKRLEKIRDYINANLDKDLRALTIAAAFEMEQYRLARHFSRHFSMTLFRYVRQQRMNKAMHLLSSNMLPVFETAKAVGYPDKFSFSHAFTNFFGRSPIAVLKEQNKVTEK